MKFIAALFLISLMSMPVMAVDEKPPHKPKQPDVVTIDKKACRHLIKHYAQPDVAYQPGVDVRGKKVVPADVYGAAQIDLPDVITIKLTSDLRQWLPNQNYPFNRVGASEFSLGDITVEGDRVTYNGQPLTDPAQEQLAVLCLQPH